MFISCAPFVVRLVNIIGKLYALFVNLDDPKTLKEKIKDVLGGVFDMYCNIGPLVVGTKRPVLICGLIRDGDRGLE